MLCRFLDFSVVAQEGRFFLLHLSSLGFRLIGFFRTGRAPVESGGGRHAEF